MRAKTRLSLILLLYPTSDTIKEPQGNTPNDGDTSSDRERGLSVFFSLKRIISLTTPRPVNPSGLTPLKRIIEEVDSWCPRLNGQRLVEFLPPGEGPELRVKSALLWIRLEARSTPPQRNVTLWAIRIKHHLPNATHLSGK
ncbi:hypothetical protein GE061_016837, partial [Apolygus lucorum]